jgi:Domain of unknown function (DUF4214)/FG-GAP-like repeat/FG-GAP repeat
VSSYQQLALHLILNFQMTRGNLRLKLVKYLFALVLTFITTVQGQQLTLPPNYPNFPVTVPGGGRVIYCQPAIADLGPSSGAKSIIFGDAQGRLSVLLNNGTMAAGFPVQLPAPIASSPAIGDINGDGQPDIVVGYGSPTNLAIPGGIRAYSKTGQLIWSKSMQDFDMNGVPDAVFSTPAIGDVDGDGMAEVAFGSFDARVYLVKGADGTDKHNWPRYVRDTIWSSPAMHDMDGDGTLEIIIGVDEHLDPYHDTIDGGSLHVFHYDGMEFNGFPVRVDQVITSSPAVGDVDGDGQPDIVFGTGTFYQGRLPKLYAVKKNGAFVAGWPVVTDTFIRQAPALADINNDGQLDVIATGALINTNPPTFRCEAFTGLGVRLFSTTPKDFFGNSYSAVDAVVADVLGDANPEILFPTNSEVCVLSNNGTQLTNRPPYAGGTLSFYTDTELSNVVVTDLNDDGVLEVIAVSAGPAPSAVDTKIYVWNPKASTSAAPKWSAFRQNAANRNAVAPNTPIGNRPRYLAADPFVRQLYRDFLNREGDTGGIANWTNAINAQTLTRAEVALQFFQSPEFQRSYGTITRYYLGLLFRRPDYAGLLNWTNYLVAGGCGGNSCSETRRQQIVDAFIASPEFTQRFGGNLTNQQFVTLLYQNILERTPTPTEMQDWVNTLNAGVMTRGQVARGFVESEEFVTVRSPVKTFIILEYIGFLRRAPEDTGYNAWVSALSRGYLQVELIQSFITSDEYLNRVAP